MHLRRVDHIERLQKALLNGNVAVLLRANKSRVRAECSMARAECSMAKQHRDTRRGAVLGGKNVDLIVFLLPFVLDGMTLLSLSGIFPFCNGVLKLF